MIGLFSLDFGDFLLATFLGDPWLSWEGVVWGLTVVCLWMFTKQLFKKHWFEEFVDFYGVVSPQPILSCHHDMNLFAKVLKVLQLIGAICYIATQPLKLGIYSDVRIYWAWTGVLWTIKLSWDLEWNPNSHLKSILWISCSLWAALLGPPHQDPVCHKEECQNSPALQAADFIKGEQTISNNRFLGITDCSRRRIFLSEPSVSWDVDKGNAISSLVLGMSSQGCCRGSHALYTDWFPWLHREWCPLGFWDAAALSVFTHTYSLYSGEKLTTK